MASFDSDESYVDLTILVTGFGPFLDIKSNPSWSITSNLPPIITHHGLTIRILKQNIPLAVSYSTIFASIPPLLEEVKADVVLHIGLAADRSYYAIESSATRLGYQNVPDNDRKVFSKAQIASTWPKSPEKLTSTLDLPSIQSKWTKGLARTKSQAKTVLPDVRVSDDIGTFVCGFVYYLSLEWFWSRKSPSRPVLFLHLPNLPKEGDVRVGEKVTLALIKAIVEDLPK